MTLRHVIPGFLAILLTAAGIGVAMAQAGETESPDTSSLAGTAVLIEIKDAISPATREFFLRTLERAEDQEAAFLVLILDTPGAHPALHHQ